MEKIWILLQLSTIVLASKLDHSTTLNEHVPARGGSDAIRNLVLPEQAAFILSTDLDDTLVGDAEGLEAFNRIWVETLSKKGCKLIYNTGRSLEDYKLLLPRWNLLVPDIFIGGCGTQMYTFNKMGGNEVADQEWVTKLNEDWDKSAISQALNSSSTLQSKYGAIWEKRESWCNPRMLSVRLDGAAAVGVSTAREDFERALEGLAGPSGRRISFQVGAASVAYNAKSTVTGARPAAGGGAVFVDVLPEAAGKGAALAFAARRLAAAQEGPSDLPVVVAGDSGNDAPMFAPGVAAAGILVANARAELRAAAAAAAAAPGGPRVVTAQTGERAWGVLEGLRLLRLAPSEAAELRGAGNKETAAPVAASCSATGAPS